MHKFWDVPEGKDTTIRFLEPPPMIWQEWNPNQVVERMLTYPYLTTWLDIEVAGLLGLGLTDSLISRTLADREVTTIKLSADSVED